MGYECGGIYKYCSSVEKARRNTGWLLGELARVLFVLFSKIHFICGAFLSSSAASTYCSSSSFLISCILYVTTLF